MGAVVDHQEGRKEERKKERKEWMDARKPRKQGRKAGREEGTSKSVEQEGAPFVGHPRTKTRAYHEI